MILQIVSKITHVEMRNVLEYPPQNDQADDLVLLADGTRK
jgi:hypothetical protein